MKNYALAIVVLVIGVTSSYGQAELDSLHNILRTHKSKDSLRLNILNAITYNYFYTDPQQGLQYGDSAIALALSLHDEKRLAKAFANKGHSLSALGKDSTALELYDRSIEIYQKHKDFEGIAKTKYNQGLIYFSKADYPESTIKYREALEYFTQEKDTFLMAKMWNSIGINCMYLSDYPNSLESYLRASKLYIVSGHAATIDEAQVYANIGILYTNLGKYDQALDYQEKALTIYRNKEYTYGIGNSLISIGNIFDSKDNPKKALEFFREAHKIGEAISNKRIISASLTNMGIAYFSLLKYKLAVEHLEKTRKIYKELDDDHDLSIVYNYLGEINAAMAEKEMSHSSPEGHFMNALIHSKKAESLQSQSRAMFNLSKLYHQQNRYKRAYEVIIEATSLKDSILSQEKREKIVRLEMEYDFRQKEEKWKYEKEKAETLALMESEKRKMMRTFSFMGGSAFLLFSYACFFFYKRHRDAKQITTESDLRAKIVDTELKALRSQMNPHFIFNSLNSIKDFISQKETNIAEDYLTKFGRLMRLTLEFSEKKTIPLEDDLNLIKLYLELEAMRLNYRFDYNIFIDSNIDKQNILIPPLLLQPFIENSIWHGISQKSTRGHISIYIKQINDTLLCIVEDDGVGLKKSKNGTLKNENSLGIKITKTRIDILNQLKNKKGTVRLVNKDQGLRVEVELPLELAF